MLVTGGIKRQRLELAIRRHPDRRCHRRVRRGAEIARRTVLDYFRDPSFVPLGDFRDHGREDWIAALDAMK